MLYNQHTVIGFSGDVLACPYFCFREGAAMRRSFLGVSTFVRDTEGNRLLGGVLLRIEEALTRLFGVPADSCFSFAEWSARASVSRPRLKYFLDWLGRDSRIIDSCQCELGDSISDALLDEIEITGIIFSDASADMDANVLCSEMADAFVALVNALHREAKVCTAREITAEQWSFYATIGDADFCYNASYDVSSSQDEGDFLFSA